jgi:hypothetical protein
MPVHKLLDPYTDPPNPGTLHTQPLIKLKRLRIDLASDVGGCRKCRRAGQLCEVSESHRDGDRAAHHLLFSHPASRAISHPE